MTGIETRSMMMQNGRWDRIRNPFFLAAREENVRQGQNHSERAIYRYSWSKRSPSFIISLRQASRAPFHLLTLLQKP